MERILPAYPIFVKDPYFSFWTKTEDFGTQSVMFWTGEEKGVYGIVRVDGKPYTFLGNVDGVEAAKATNLSLTAFSTDFAFTAGNALCKVRFVSPLPPDNLETLSCPVCYMEFEASGSKDIEWILAMRQDVCYTPEGAGRVHGGTATHDGIRAAFFGKREQAPFTHNEDRSCADWGYFYLSGKDARYLTEAEFFDCVGLCGGRDETKYIMATESKQKGVLFVGYDDVASIKYFGNVLRGYYLQNHTIWDALSYTRNNIAKINESLTKYDATLNEQAGSYGEAYRNVLIASLRQSLGAHKLVRSPEGEVLFLSKECFSNGCMATVDITYPSSPLYLLYNPELLRGMLRPVFKFASMPVWKYDFAPHDIGTYPIACGQVYGMQPQEKTHCGEITEGGERKPWFDLYTLPESVDLYNFDSQMPVEESANILILLDALFRVDGDVSLFRKNQKMLKSWVSYLVRYGLKPANQLCTDDFAGHLANNVNLAIKATVGIACYADLCGAVGKSSLMSKYRSIAEDYAAQISELASGRDCLPLTWEGGNTFSLKYNLIFDKILKLNLFSQELNEKETDAYLCRADKFGVKLDNRATYTKSDWLMWAAALTDSLEKRNRFIALLNTYLAQSPTRLPFGDWYDAVSGEAMPFRNRAVQGGCFMLLL